MYGLSIIFPSDAKQKVLKKICDTVDVNMSITTLYNSDRAQLHLIKTQIRMKSPFEFVSTRVVEALAEIDVQSAERKYRVCSRGDCFEEVLAASSPVLSKFMLFDRYGENWHEIHWFCRAHCNASTRFLMDRVQCKLLAHNEVGKIYVLSFPLRSKYYAQKVSECFDGVVEPGEWTSPYPTREEAIKAAAEEVSNLRERWHLEVKKEEQNEEISLVNMRPIH